MWNCAQLVVDYKKGESVVSQALKGSRNLNVIKIRALRVWAEGTPALRARASLQIWRDAEGKSLITRLLFVCCCGARA